MKRVTRDPPEMGRGGSQVVQRPRRTLVHPAAGSLRCRSGTWVRLSIPAPGDASQTLEDLKELGSGTIPKAVPLGMAQKRLLRELREADSALQDGNWTQWETTHRKTLRHFQREFHNALSYMEIWRHSLRKIEGRFGTGIGSYFSVHRFLVVLNLGSFLLLCGLVVIPLLLDGRGSDSLPTAPPETPSPGGSCTQYDHSNPGLVSFYEVILDILSGTGRMEFSLLFYGYYPERGLDLWGARYQLPLAYVLSVGACFLASFTWITHRAVLGYKQSFLLSGGTLSNYSQRVFCGWDFCLSQPGAVAFRHSNLREQLKMALEEDMSRRRCAERTRSQTALLVSRRVLVNALTLLVIGGAFYAIYQATEFSQSSPSGEGVKSLLTEYLPSIVITAANFVTPLLFQQLVVLERYTAATEIKLTLLRCVFLKMASLGVLLYSLWNQITCQGQLDSDPWCRNCGYNYQQYQVRSRLSLTPRPPRPRSQAAGQVRSPVHSVSRHSRTRCRRGRTWRTAHGSGSPSCREGGVEPERVRERFTGTSPGFELQGETGQ
ncbi:transmembrane channel-like protein 7, partial [Pristis pectinata]|uniref:transmembrane channel-like protein 7 n=1 Tax=Pristis pectinata TaxID=685728 RepID=UPI00223CB143